MIRRFLPVFLLPAALLLYNSSVRIGHDRDKLFLYWRSFDDFAIADAYATRGQFPVASYRVRNFTRREGDPRFRDFRDRFFAKMDEQGVGPQTFWRTIPGGLSPDGQWRTAQRFDDGGRALVLGMVYRVLGGSAPYLLFWMSVLLCVPVFAYIAFESVAAGRTVAGFVFLTAAASSTFLADMLCLGYSAVSFHILGLLLLAGLSIFALFGHATPRGVLVRFFLCGLALGVFAICRGTVPSILPGFLLAGVVACTRATSEGANRGRRRIVLLAAALFLLCLSYPVILRMDRALVERTMDEYHQDVIPLYHDPALHVWMGLGDFDRTKGYQFTDKAVEEAVIRASEGRGAARAAESNLRKVIWDDIRTDPFWFAGVLSRRLAATVLMYKLWPFGPMDGISIIPAGSPNEGVTDSYYLLASQADWFMFGVAREFPVFLVVLPGLTFAGARLWIALRGRNAPPSLSVAAFGVLACLSLGVLPLPVLLTTATAFESQAFLLVHLLALGFLVEAALTLWRWGHPKRESGPR